MPCELLVHGRARPDGNILLTGEVHPLRAAAVATTDSTGEAIQCKLHLHHTPAPSRIAKDDFRRCDKLPVERRYRVFHLFALNHVALCVDKGHRIAECTRCKVGGP